MCVDPFFYRPGSVDSNQVYRLLNTTITRALKLEPNNASWIIIQGHIFCGKHTYAQSVCMYKFPKHKFMI